MYTLIANVIRISYAKIHCNRSTTVQDIQDYASLILYIISLFNKNDSNQTNRKEFLWHSVVSHRKGLKRIS